ncbi:MAG: hypothetical protein OQL08_12380 [Gammaproteobacteria bacterium]|nr:hypothetical protein [Gammaproteobacteria bacterium]
MIQALVILLVMASSASAEQSLDELEQIDITIHAAPNYPGRINPLQITTKGELTEWAKPLAYEETDVGKGVTSFIVKWPEATVSGFFPSSHCCTEVLFGEFVTNSKKWSFFGKIRIGDTADKALSDLAPIAKRDKDKMKYCGLNECAVFTIKNGRISEVSLLLYTD